MSSFFEKLIGSQAETPKAAGEKPLKPADALKKPSKKPVKQKAVKPEEKEPEFFLKPEVEMAKEEKTELVLEKENKEEKKMPERNERKPVPAKDWPETLEGKLAVDIFQTDQEIVIQSAIAGVKPENLEVTIENGMVKILGHREKSETATKDGYLVQECHWGAFSRQFVLPSEVDASRAQAGLKDGILTIRIPRIQKEKVTKLQIK